ASAAPNQAPAKLTVGIFDGLGDTGGALVQQAEDITVVLSGQNVGTISVDKNRPRAGINVTISSPGTYQYRLSGQGIGTVTSAVDPDLAGLSLPDTIDGAGVIDVGGPGRQFTVSVVDVERSAQGLVMICELEEA